jgi:hypothetical protein
MWLPPTKGGEAYDRRNIITIISFNIFCSSGSDYYSNYLNYSINVHNG